MDDKKTNAKGAWPHLTLEKMRDVSFIILSETVLIALRKS